LTVSTALECRQLTFDYTGHRSQKYHRPVLQHIDAVFASGRITLVSGNSGAGKSTLLHLLAGLMRPVGGEVWADGQPVSRWRAGYRDRWRRQVGILFQQDHLIGDLSALENVMLPLIPRSGKLRRWRDDSRNLLARLNVGALAGTPVDALSGGQRQRVAAARALVAAPDYILADEPVAHQDRDNAGRVGDLLRRAADEGSVVVVAAHDRHVGDWLAVDRHLVLANRSLKPAT
jgi:putative ABC transport system ATP-binding protein